MRESLAARNKAEDLVSLPLEHCTQTGNLLAFSFGCAKVAELADAPDLGSGAVRCGGSSPPFRTIIHHLGPSLSWSIIVSLRKVYFELTSRCGGHRRLPKGTHYRNPCQ